VIFQWVEKVREFLHACTVDDSKTNIPASEEMATERSLPKLEDDFPIAHGEPLAAGKCTFQGHTASVQNITQVK
jgi:hypothetical protein